MSTLLMLVIVLAVVLVTAWLVLSPLNDATRDDSSPPRPGRSAPDPAPRPGDVPRGGDGYPTIFGRMRAAALLVAVSALGGAAVAVVVAVAVFLIVRAASSSLT